MGAWAALGSALGKAAGAVGKNLKGKFGPQQGQSGDQQGGDQQGGGKQKQKRPPMQITPPSVVESKKKGGPVKKTGVYLLHKNEYVVPAKRRSSGKSTSRRKTVTKL